MAIFNIQRTITLKVGKQELWIMCSARRLLVFNICVKFHENNTICRGYNQRYGSCVLHVVSWFNICVKFHENMSSGFKLMERTRKLLTHKGQ